MKNYYLLLCLVFKLSNLFPQSFNWAVNNLPNTIGKTEDLKTDHHNHLITACTFYNSFDPDGTLQPLTPLSGYGAYDSYIGKYDMDGQYKWGFVLGSNSDDLIKAITLDNDDNIYAIGNYYDTLDFDPSASVHNLYPYPGTFAYQVFVAKYDSSGNYEWAGSINCQQEIYCYGLTYSPDGFIYVGGVIKDTTDFDLGPGVFNVNQAGFAGFIAKYDLNGQLVWVHLLKGNGGYEYCVVKSMTVDNNYNLFVAGQNGDSVDVDPGANNYFIHAGNFANSVFVSSYDSSGSFRWAFSFGGNVISDVVKNITLDDAGNCYVTGLYYDRVDLDPGPDSLVYHSLNGDQDIFLASYTNDGNLRWGKRMYGYSLEGDGDVEISSGKLYVVGNFTGRIDFDSSQTGFVMDNSASVSHNVFVARYDTSGNFHHAFVFGGDNTTVATELTIGPSDETVFGGFFRDTVNFQLGSLSDKRFGGSNGAVFFASYSECSVSPVYAIDSICIGETYSFGYLNLDTTGTYMQVLKNFSGCDSVVTLDLIEYPLPVITAFASDYAICAGDSVFVWALGEPNHFWWNPNVDDSIPFTPIATASYFVEGTNTHGCVNYSSVVVDVNPIPAVPQIFVTGADTLFIIVPGDSTQWYLNGNPILNSNNWFIAVTASGNYSVSVFYATGCSSTSAPVFFQPVGLSEINKTPGFTFTPNPAHDKIFVHANSVKKEVSISNIQGRVLIRQLLSDENAIDISQLTQGVYFLQYENKKWKFVKT